MGGEVEKKTFTDKTIEHFLSPVVIKEKKQQLLYLDLELLFCSSSVFFFLVLFCFGVICKVQCTRHSEHIRLKFTLVNHCK